MELMPSTKIEGLAKMWRDGELNSLSEDVVYILFISSIRLRIFN